MSLDPTPVSPSAQAHGPLAPGRALVVLIGLIAALAGYLTISHLLAIVPTYAGILLLFYWFAAKGGAPEAFPAAFVGALAGIGNAALLAMPGLAPGASALLGLAVLALYCLLAGFVPLIFNQAYMLLLTVAAIPPVLAGRPFVGMAASVVLSGLYFGGLIWFLRLVARRVSERRIGASRS